MTDLATTKTAAMDIAALMASAVEQGAGGVEALERLVALQERIMDRNARQSYFDALKSFQAECRAIPKNKTASIASRSGTGYSYAFADLEQIVSVVRPVLDKHGLSFSFDSKVEGTNITTTCTLRHRDGHAEQSSFTCPVASPNPGMSEQQKYGGAFTFSRRYALVGALGLATTDEDTDGREQPDLDEEGVITDEQALTLEALANDVGADWPKFMFYLGRLCQIDCQLPDIRQLPASHYKTALAALNRKAKAAR
jgi:hypothetical protein